jgi:UDP-N-acetylmuramoylalanine--D-glutamate ligase
MNNQDYRILPKSASIIGAARSGIAVARYLTERKVPVFISDSCPAAKLEQVLAKNGLAGVPHEAGGHTEKVLANEVIILSPGVPSDLPVLKTAANRHQAVWSEMEFGFRQSRAPFLAVTGSSGKSTTTSLLGEIMKADGRETAVAGNIGTPVISLAPPVGEKGVVVAEVSSFQLENIDAFKPRVAAIINLMKNHLDRYASEQAYYEAKKNIVKNMDMNCHLVVNARDGLLKPWAMGLTKKTRVVFFGAPVDAFPCVWYENGTIVSTMDRERVEVLAVASMKLQGPHNYDNAAAAAAMARAAGASYGAIARAISSFEGLPHRLQFAGEVNGVRFYNDSKSTTAESVLVAVTAFGNNVHLIAGGRDKGCDFSVVKAALRERVKEVLLIGEAADRMQTEWRGVTSIVRVGSLAAAVDAARAKAQPGDVVVLSPGCSSFDMFANFEERGEVFMNLVRERMAVS